MVDDPNANLGFAPSYWATLSPRFRAAHNRLRQARGLPPIPEPKVDRYKPPQGSVRPIDPADPAAIVAARDYLGLNNPARPWMRGAEEFAIERASGRPTDQDRPHLETHRHTITDKPRELRTPYGKEGEEWWAKLGPARRKAFNQLRQQRARERHWAAHLSPYREPAVDLSPKPAVPAPKPFDKPSALAKAIARGDHSAETWQALLAETEARLAEHDSGAERPAHRPKTLSRRIAEGTVMRLLHLWDRLPPEQRWSLRTVRDVIHRDYGIARTVVHELLQKIRGEHR
jgi:hypothetical protein